MRHEPPPMLSGLGDEEAFIAMTQLGYFGVSFAVRHDGAGIPHAQTTIGLIHGERRFTGDQQAAIIGFRSGVRSIRARRST